MPMLQRSISGLVRSASNGSRLALVARTDGKCCCPADDPDDPDNPPTDCGNQPGETCTRTAVTCSYSVQNYNTAGGVCTAVGGLGFFNRTLSRSGGGNFAFVDAVQLGIRCIAGSWVWLAQVGNSIYFGGTYTGACPPIKAWTRLGCHGSGDALFSISTAVPCCNSEPSFSITGWLA